MLLAFDVGEGLRDSVIADAHDINPPDMASSPAVPPQDEYSVAGGDQVLDIEVNVRSASQQLATGLEHSLATYVSATVWWGRVFEDTVIGDEVSQGFEIVTVESLIEKSDRLGWSPINHKWLFDL